MNDILSGFKVPTTLIDGFTINMIVLAVILGVMLLAYLAMRGPGIRSKIVAFAMIPFIGCAVIYAMLEQLSHPKELSISWLKNQGENGVSIHGTIIVPPRLIHIWIDYDHEPRNFFVPWSKELEESLQAAMEENKDGEGGDLRLRFEPSLDETMKFYSLPWPAPAPKDEPGESEDPLRVEQDA